MQLNNIRVNKLVHVNKSTSCKVTPPATPPATPHVVVQPPPAVQETSVINPYQGSIKPTTSNGLKMYQSATTARETLLNPEIKTKKEFLDVMVSDSARFGWSSLINNVNVGGKSFSILKDVQKPDVDKVRRYTSKYLYMQNSTELPPADHGLVLYEIYPEHQEAHKEVFLLERKLI